MYSISFLITFELTSCSSQFSSHPLNSLSIFVQFNTDIHSVQSQFVQFNSYIHSVFAKINSILGSGSSGKIDSMLESGLSGKIDSIFHEWHVYKIPKSLKRMD